MAGTRQHFLPRFLMMGFSSKIQKNEYYTWVFTKDRPPYETNLKNIGLEKFFYGKPEVSHVDKIITDQEAIYSGQIDKIREIDFSCSLDSSFSPEFITHMIVRAKHLRESIQEVGTTIVDVAKRKLDGPKKFHQMLLNIVVNHPELIEESLSKEFDKILPPDFPEHLKILLFEYAKYNIPSIVANPTNSTEGYSLFSQAFSHLANKMPEIAKDAHIRALSKDIVPLKWAERFTSLVWSLIVTNEHTFILGDIGPIAQYKPNLDFYPFLFAKGELSQVFIPISEKHMIVGKSNINLQLPELTEINEASAFLSKHFFISSKKSEAEKNLSCIISSRSSNISSNEIAEAEKTIDKSWFGIEDN